MLPDFAVVTPFQKGEAFAAPAGISSMQPQHFIFSAAQALHTLFTVYFTKQKCPALLRGTLNTIIR